jgi:NADPH2:quinone reductase
MADLLDLTAAGRLRPLVGGEYPMSDVGTAHHDLRERRSVGKLVIDPTK